MTNTYRAITEHGVALHGPDVFEEDWSPADEKDALDSGHVELVPRMYRIQSGNFSGGPQGGEYRAALLKENEAALIQGGHLSREDEPAGYPDPYTTDAAPVADEVADDEVADDNNVEDSAL